MLKLNELAVLGVVGPSLKDNADEEGNNDEDWLNPAEFGVNNHLRDERDTGKDCDNQKDDVVGSIFH